MSEHEDEARTESSPRRVFELYVDELVGEAEALDEALVVRLRWFSQDIEAATKKLADDPAAVVQVIHGLSTFMQELDTQAGRTEGARRHLGTARRWAVLIPETPQP